MSRAFGGVQAAMGVSLEVERDTVHGLIGPNGAGKTTILNLICGILKPDSGSILLHGLRLDMLPPFRIAQLGVRRTYQTTRLFGGMTACENVIVGLHAQSGDSIWQRLVFSPVARRKERELIVRARSALAQAGIERVAEWRARDLPYGGQRRLEIARALASDPVLLLLDEPTAGMSVREAANVGDLVRKLAQKGTAVLLIEHNVELVMSIATSVTVLNFGRVIASGKPDVVRRDPAVIEAYLGAED
ncbi:MAG TPA: ABC transporter ATP-binding protein [Dehalococcoidia bacterium]|nr:ABC transporter ATP-binding protein [Dehalococcoidia bacterium]